MGDPRQNPLFAALPVPAFVADGSGTVLDVSSAWESHLGRTVDRLVGQPLWDACDEPLATRLRERWTALGEDGELVLEAEAGTRRVRVEARVAAGGEVVGTVVDVTELAAQADAPRRLAGQLAHGVNNLMTVVIGNIELGQQRAGREDAADRALDRALEAALETAEMAGQMLAYAGQGAVHPLETDLHALASKVLSELRPSVPKRTLLELRGEAGCLASGDPGQLRQLITNLLLNAGEAIGETRNGEISLTLSRVDLDAAALQDSLVAPPEPGAFVVLEVADDGPGMDADTRARLFDPFFSTKTQRRGLGLSAVLGIVRGHQGALWIRTAPGTGTTVRVALPLAATQAATDTAEAPVPPRVVLIAEDEDSIRRITRRTLERAGYQVIEARDGEEAIALFQANADRIGVALLDSLMPGFSGTQVLQQIRAARPGFPVVVCSGNIDRSGVGPEQPSALLPKPFLPKDLIRVLESTLEPKG